MKYLEMFRAILSLYENEIENNLREKYHTIGFSIHKHILPGTSLTFCEGKEPGV